MFFTAFERNSVRGVVVKILLAIAFVLGLLVFGCTTQQQVQSPTNVTQIQPAMNCSPTLKSGDCAPLKPFYCNEGKLISRSDICGCPDGWRPNGTKCAYSFPCNDGTLTPDCSGNKPYQCINKTLFENAGLCGCPDDYKAQGNACTKIQRCDDGTIYGECSSKQPLFCDNGVLIEKAPQCGCIPEFYVTGEQCADSRPSSSFSAVYISKKNIDRLDSKFAYESDEFLFCIRARRLGENLIITDFTKIGDQIRSSKKVISEPCPKGTYNWGVLHSHPNGVCLLSEQDIDTFIHQNINDGAQITGIICGKEHLAFYSILDYINTVKIFKILGNEFNLTDSVEITPIAPCAGNLQYRNGKCWEK